MLAEVCREKSTKKGTEYANIFGFYDLVDLGYPPEDIKVILPVIQKAYTEGYICGVTEEQCLCYDCPVKSKFALEKDN